MRASGCKARIAIRAIHVPKFRVHVSPKLLNNIKQLGLLNPILVFCVSRKYYLIDGLARVHALRELGRKRIDAIVLRFKGGKFDASDYETLH